MPDHINRRIAFLRELAESGLHQENLDKIVAECSSLSQDTPYVLVFFVLKHLFRELSSVWDGEAISVEQFQELNSGVKLAFVEILEKAEKGEGIGINELESIVRIHINNVNVFKTGR